MAGAGSDADKMARYVAEIAAMLRRIEQLENASRILTERVSTLEAAPVASTAAISGRLDALEPVVENNKQRIEVLGKALTEAVSKLGSSVASVHHNVSLIVGKWSVAFEDIKRFMEPVSHAFTAEQDATQAQLPVHGPQMPVHAVANGEYPF